MKTRGNTIENVFFLRYEKVWPHLSFCYLHSLRSPIINARAGGANLNLFYFHQLCIRFRSVVVITSALKSYTFSTFWQLLHVCHSFQLSSF